MDCFPIILNIFLNINVIIFNSKILPIFELTYIMFSINKRISQRNNTHLYKSPIYLSNSDSIPLIFHEKTLKYKSVSI